MYMPENTENTNKTENTENTNKKTKDNQNDSCISINVYCVNSSFHIT